MYSFLAHVSWCDATCSPCVEENFLDILGKAYQTGKLCVIPFLDTHAFEALSTPSG
jgi:hypothetical protein